MAGVCGGTKLFTSWAGHTHLERERDRQTDRHGTHSPLQGHSHMIRRPPTRTHFLTMLSKG
jgi:hypothetical protein